MTIETAVWTPIFGVFYNTRLFDIQSNVDYLVWRQVATPVQTTADVIYAIMLDKLGDDLRKESQVLFQ